MKKQSLAADALLRSLRSLEAERKLIQGRLGKKKTRLLTLGHTEAQIEKEAGALEQEIRELASAQKRLAEKKKDIELRARAIGQQRTDLINQRRAIYSEVENFHGSLAILDQKRQKQEVELAGMQGPRAAAPPRPSPPRRKKMTVAGEIPLRSHKRLSFEVEVNLTTKHNFFTGHSQNISEGGLFLATDESLPVGTPIDLTIHLPEQIPIEAPGEVRWLQNNKQFSSPGLSPGVGVAFTGLNKGDQRVLEQFIKLRAPLRRDGDSSQD